MVTGPSSLYGIKPDIFFNLKGLNPAAIAKLEQTVKTSKETLALADHLQTMRDNGKKLLKLEQSLKHSSSLGRRLLDLYS